MEKIQINHASDKECLSKIHNCKRDLGISEKRLPCKSEGLSLIPGPMVEEKPEAQTHRVVTKCSKEIVKLNNSVMYVLWEKKNLGWPVWMSVHS